MDLSFITDLKPRYLASMRALEVQLGTSDIGTAKLNAVLNALVPGVVLDISLVLVDSEYLQLPQRLQHPNTSGILIYVQQTILRLTPRSVTFRFQGFTQALPRLAMKSIESTFRQSFSLLYRQTGLVKMVWPKLQSETFVTAAIGCCPT